MKTATIGEIKVPLMVVLGETRLPVSSVATIREGTIIELDKLAGEPVSLLAAGETVAKGEVVVIDENFGIRVTEVLAPQVAAELSSKEGK